MLDVRFENEVVIYLERIQKLILRYNIYEIYTLRMYELILLLKLVGNIKSSDCYLIYYGQVRCTIKTLFKGHLAHIKYGRADKSRVP